MLDNQVLGYGISGRFFKPWLLLFQFLKPGILGINLTTQEAQKLAVNAGRRLGGLLNEICHE